MTRQPSLSLLSSCLIRAELSSNHNTKTKEKRQVLLGNIKDEYKVSNLTYHYGFRATIHKKEVVRKMKDRKNGEEEAVHANEEINKALNGDDNDTLDLAPLLNNNAAPICIKKPKRNDET